MILSGARVGRLLGGHLLAGLLQHLLLVSDGVDVNLRAFELSLVGCGARGVASLAKI